MNSPIDARERDELWRLIDRLGPDAPTLCAGWTTSDLAAHLVLREHFHRWSDEQIAKEKAKGFTNLVLRLMAGPPPFPWRLPVIRNYANGLEFFVHHEDVRRANGQAPRVAEPDLEKLCWRMSGFLGRRLARAIGPFGLELVDQNGHRRRFGSDDAVVLSGPATELALFLSGRRSAARVEIAGSDEAVAALATAESKL